MRRRTSPHFNHPVTLGGAIDLRDPAPYGRREMSAGPLQRLVEAARSLPGDKLTGLRRWPVRMEPTTEVSDGTRPELPAELLDLPSLRRRVAELLAELARRIEPALEGALRRAASAWDQVDALTVLDTALAARVAGLRSDGDAMRRSGDRTLAAAGLEVLLTVGAAVDLVALIERRLATLVRIRLRDGTHELLPEGRPFLDLAAALDEAARVWA